MSDVTDLFNGASGNVVSTSRTSITALVPLTATTGAIAVNVAGQSATGPVFTVFASTPSTNLALTTGTFIDATAGGTALTFVNNDDADTIATLPFGFTLFNKSYPAGATIAVSTNGWLSLDAFSRPQFQNGPLPGTALPPALVAPFFADLFLPGGASVITRTAGTAPNRQFVVEWLNAGILDGQGNDLGSSITFEAVLYEGSNDIQFMYASANGPKSDGSGATIGIQDSTRTQAFQTGYNQSVVSTGTVVAYHFVNGTYVTPSAPPPVIDTQYNIPNLGGLSVLTDGAPSATATGFATVQPSTGSTTPSGVSIFGYTINNVLVSEAGVPASPVLTSGRIYAEISSTVNTGLAIANPNNQPATISYYFTDSTGTDSNNGTITVPANGHLAEFLNDPSLGGIKNFQGSFTFTSTTVPVSVIALHGFTNERGDFLMSTLPVTALPAPVVTATTVIPHFADGGGWTTQIILVNPTDSPMAGNVTFLTPAGQTLSTSAYSIPKRSSFKQVTPGTSSAIQTGSVQVIPATGNTPTSVAIFSNRPNGITVSQAAVLPTTGLALRMYVEGAGGSGVGNIQSGVALANVSGSATTVTFSLTDLTGASLGTATANVPANGQLATFISGIFPNVSLPFKGVLRVSTTTGTTTVSVAELRGRYNQRGDFLMSTTPPTDENGPTSSAPSIFPHIVNGGGFTTQFVLFSGTKNQTAIGNLHLTYAN
jgi:hypothetical protein